MFLTVLSLWLNTSTLKLEVGTSPDGKQKTATARMVFRPTLRDRLLRGKRDVVITHPIAEGSKLFTRNSN